MTSEEFSRIQKEAGLSDRELSRRLDYGNNGRRKIRRFKSGDLEIPEAIAAKMKSLIDPRS